VTSSTQEATREIANRSYAGGLALALTSAMSFGLSGSLARSLLDLGWSPAAVVVTRVGGAFLVLLIPCLFLIRRIGLPTGRQGARILAYGAIAIALAQLCYFSAVQYLSVGIALLLEYLAPVLLIGWHWARTHHRPAVPVLAGAGLSILGLAFVLDLRGGLTLNPVGVAWGLAAALCLCAYFLLSEDNGSDVPVNPLLLTTAGTGIGAALLLAAAGVGIIPLSAHAGTTTMAGQAVGWWLPAALLILISAVLAYPTGIVAVRRLGSSAASFVSLIEVIFAVIFAFMLLGQRPGPMQLLGGALILTGIVLVQRPRVR
jgi:drug/metabolite transporter (DMT)-like permease